MNPSVETRNFASGQGFGTKRNNFHDRDSATPKKQYSSVKHQPTKTRFRQSYRVSKTSALTLNRIELKRGFELLRLHVVIFQSWVKSPSEK